MNRRFSLTIVSFLGIAVLLIAISSLVGTILPKVDTASCTANATTVTQILLGCTQGIVQNLVKLVTAVLLTLLMLPLVQMLMEHKNLKELRHQMLSADNNDSPALLIAAVFISMCLLTWVTPYSVVQNYIVFLMFRLGLWIIVSIITAFFLVALIAGIRRSTTILDDFQAQGTNTVSFLIGAALIGAALLV